MKKIGFYIAFAFMWTLSWLPMCILYRLSDVMYCGAYYIIGYRKKVVVTNLRNSFPEKSEKEIRKIAKKFYLHLCDLAVETIALITISAPQIKRRVTYGGLDLIERFYDEGRPVIGAMGHYGNWEWGSSFAMHTRYKTMTAYKPIDNRDFDGLFKWMRSRFGFTPVSMKETTREMVKCIRNGEKVMLMLIADQTPAYIELHHYITFMGQDTPVFMGPEKMAKALNAPMVFTDIQKLKRGRYHITHTLMCENTKDTAPYELTNMYYQRLEEQIRQKPQYWLWSHRRWKYKRDNVQPETTTES